MNLPIGVRVAQDATADVKEASGEWMLLLSPIGLHFAATLATGSQNQLLNKPELVDSHSL